MTLHGERWTLHVEGGAVIHWDFDGLRQTIYSAVPPRRVSIHWLAQPGLDKVYAGLLAQGILVELTEQPDLRPWWDAEVSDWTKQVSKP